MEGERERGREAENGCRMGMTMEGRKEMRRDERTNLQFKPQCGILDTPVWQADWIISVCLLAFCLYFTSDIFCRLVLTDFNFLIWYEDDRSFINQPGEFRQTLQLWGQTWTVWIARSKGQKVKVVTRKMCSKRTRQYASTAWSWSYVFFKHFDSHNYNLTPSMPAVPNCCCS